MKLLLVVGQKYVQLIPSAEEHMEVYQNAIVNQILKEICTVKDFLVTIITIGQFTNNSSNKI